MKKLYIFLLTGIIATASSCTYTFPEDEAPTAGSADFTKVVAVGNSLTAGYMNGALYDDGQAASFANIVALQMQQIGGGEFNQPDINAVDGYYGESGGVTLGRLHLVNPVSPAPSPIIPGQDITAYAGGKSLNNFGVPGIRIVDANVFGYGTVNPYFGRFAADPNSSSVIGDAAAAKGSFFLFWLGGNDVLGYAIAGATGSEEGSLPTDMSSVTNFEISLAESINALSENGAKGIVANVPNVQDIPHFKTVPWDAIPMDAATAEGTNAAYAPYNGGLDAMVANQLLTQAEADLRYIIFEEGQNGVVIIDEELTDLTVYNPALVSMRMTNSDDLLTLSSGAVLGTLADPADPTSVIGVGVPLDEVYTLTLANQNAIANRTADLNAAIASEVSASNGNLALLDINSIFADFAQNGASIHGAGMDATILPPFGAFSLDGVHPNARGSAYVASLFIDKINEVFGSNIPNVNPNNYAGNELPIP